MLLLSANPQIPPTGYNKCISSVSCELLLPQSRGNLIVSKRDTEMKRKKSYKAGGGGDRENIWLCNITQKQNDGNF